MLSYSRGPDALLIEKTIGRIFLETADLNPDRVALISVYQNVRLTYGQLCEAAEQVARGLAGLGLHLGDRAGIWSCNCLEWILLQLGCAISMATAGCTPAISLSWTRMSISTSTAAPRAEIEAFLMTHPKVADVCVVGLPDVKLGEAVLAWVRLRAGVSATEGELRESCAGKIAHFKIPQFIRFVDAFPMTVSGKIQRFRIREQEIEERGLQRVAKIQTA